MSEKLKKVKNDDTAGGIPPTTAGSGEGGGARPLPGLPLVYRIPLGGHYP
jgi:hypothetical protein